MSSSSLGVGGSQASGGVVAAALTFEHVAGFEYEFFMPDLAGDVRPIAKHDSVAKNQCINGCSLDDHFSRHDRSHDCAACCNQDSVGSDFPLNVSLDNRSPR